MKKINSIDYGGKVIGIGLIWLIIIPGILTLVNMRLNSVVIQYVGYVSVCLGMIIEISFFVFLAIELKQDKKIDNYYSKNPNSTKTPQQILDDK